MTYTEKLSKLVLVALYVTLGILTLKYFGTVIGYVVLGFIVALISKPVVRLLRKIKIRGKSIPDGVLAIFVIFVILGVLCALAAWLTPMFAEVVRDISALSEGSAIDGLSDGLARLNGSIQKHFSVEPDFKIEVAVAEELSSLLNFSMVGNILGTVASTIASIGVGLFSAIFIAFFLIKDEKLLRKAIEKFAPKRHQEKINSALTEIEYYLSRYFAGLLIEIAVVGMIDFFGLWGIARLNISSALGIAFMAGILNIIPYIGPLIGTLAGTFMAVVLSFCGTGTGPTMSFWIFVAVVAAIFLFAQMIDNIVLQPVIYSTSVKAHPLEIFLVLLLAGTVGGIVGMLLAIPAYTVIRVIAIQFLKIPK